MTDIQIAILIIVILALLLLALNIRIGSKDKILVVERLGFFLKAIDEPGIYFLIPLLDRVVQTVSKGVLTKSFSIKTSFDHKLNIIYEYKVIDYMLFVYEELDSLKAFEKHFEQYILPFTNLDINLMDSTVITYAKSLGIQLIKMSKNNI